MSFSASLKIGSKEFDVLNCNYKFARDVDAKGRPAASVYGGRITVTVESTADTSILEDMLNQYKPFSGSITFRKEDEEAKMKELQWENGYIIGYEEGINAVGTQPMTITFTVSAQKITLGNAQFQQNWPK